MRGPFEAVLELNLKRFSPEEAKKKHIAAARAALRQVQGQRLDKLSYQIYTDGSASTTEESVKPFGVIQYLFLRMNQIGKYAYVTARAMSPVESGRYRDSWILVADDVVVSENDVPATAKQLILVNYQPYSRKIQLRGAKLKGVPPGIVEKIQLQVRRLYGKFVSTNVSFIELRDAYVLKHDYIQTRRNGKRRLHTRAGHEITYPALIINSKF